jgi:hypothetical protein
MNNSSNIFYYFISGMLIGSTFIYLIDMKKFNLLNNKINLLDDNIGKLEKKNLNLIDHLMYLDSSSCDLYNLEHNNKNNNNDTKII